MSQFGSIDHSIELYDEATDDVTEVIVTFKFSVQPAEYEGPYLFYAGDASMESVELLVPFEFIGKQYNEIVPELAHFVIFEHGFLEAYRQEYPMMTKFLETATDNQLSTLLHRYFDFHFDKYIAPEIEIPSHRYPLE